MSRGLRERIGYVDNNVWLWGRVGVQARWDAARGARLLRAQPDRYDRVETFCNFIGYPRSGHSVVSSILDAHAEATFSHRLDALGHLAGRSPPETVFHMIERNAARFARDGRKLTAYAYPVDGQHQGRTEALRVIGDQEAKWATLRLAHDPLLLDAIPFRRAPRIRFIHVVRNPFDNIATMANRAQISLEAAAATYFQLCDGVEVIRARCPDRVLDLRHESLLAAPKEGIQTLCDFLGLTTDTGYLSACAALVSPAPHRSRHTRQWPAALRAMIERRIQVHPHLRAYANEP